MFCILKHHHVKSSHYNLEDEKLTHLGQSLGDIEKFDDIQLSDEDKEDDGNLFYLSKTLKLDCLPFLSYYHIYCYSEIFFIIYLD